MATRVVEGKKPYTGGKAISIDENKVISLNLRDENNLIIYDEGDDEIYVDLQLPDGIEPTDAFPVGVTTGRAVVADGWDKAGTIISAKTTSGDEIKILYADDGTLWIDNGTGTFKQIYFKSDVDALLLALRNYIDGELAKKQNGVSSDTAPSNPSEGDLWYDTTSNSMKVYDGTNWNTVGTGGGGSDIVYATQAEYNALLPGAESDGKHYFIYTSSAPSIYTTVTCYIDESKSDPSQMVTYGSDVPFTAGSSDWDNFFGYYPCLLNTSGVETAILDTTDYSKDKDGNSVNITSGDNVMVCFPRLGIKMSKSGSIITMQLTNDPNNPDFTYLAHQRGTTDKDKFYYGAYKAYNNSNVLKSWSGKSPAINISNNNSRSYAQANGTGYEMSAFFQRTFIQVLYIFKYANLNSQATIGKGYVSGSGVQTTGATNTSGMNYGDTSSSTGRMKLFGIEDLRGNTFEWVEGLYYNNHVGYIANHDFNLTQTNYTYTYNTGKYDGDNYMKAIFGSPSLGFLCDTGGANSNTYYCDLFSQDNNIGIPFCGGPYNFGDKAGIFCLFANDASGTYGDIGPRIMYL